MLRWLTAGESHGSTLSAILEGLPAGVRIETKGLADALARRGLGYGRGARMRFERDEVRFTGGVRHGRTLGGPVAVEIANTEWPKWREVMDPDPADADGARYDEPGRLGERGRGAPLTRPRPGHADLAGMQKYGFDDVRPVLERASARETAARVALGEVARAFLVQVLDVEIISHVAGIGGVRLPDGLVPAGTLTVRRLTGRAGGIEGGMTSGEPVRVRAAMKPISTVPRALSTVDVATGEPARAINQRSDVCSVPATGVVAEAMAAPVLADAVLEKFGGDSVTETRGNARRYLDGLAVRVGS